MGQGTGQNLERVFLPERRVTPCCDADANFFESRRRIYYHCRFIIPNVCYTNIGTS
jgi:hypothetical protein